MHRFQRTLRFSTRPPRWAGRAVLLAHLLAIWLNGQTVTGSLKGVVLDPSGAAVSGASVEINPGQSDSRTLSTDADGAFSATLQVGAYSLTVQAEGFAAETRSVAAAPPPTLPVVIQLHLSPVSENVTVSESSGYEVPATASATKTPTPLLDIPQSISILGREFARDQMLTSVTDAVAYAPGVTAIQGENNRDQVVIRGISTSADFFRNGVRDDVQYYRDLYNVERLEVIKGPSAVMFGRGGGGGVINRVTKEAGAGEGFSIEGQGGSFANRRISADWDRRLTDAVALRFNGLYATSDSFRDGVDSSRHALNPTATWTPGRETRITFGYEFFRDRRVADRGIPSYRGRPADAAVSTFYGDPEASWARANVHLGSITVERQLGPITLRNSMLAGHYDRGYQNFVPGAVNSSKTEVALSAYNNATRRTNFFNQTDFVYVRNTGPVRHAIVWGAELGRQRSANFRNTGYFNNTVTTIQVSFSDPSISEPVLFRQSAADADNTVSAQVATGYVQDQIELSRHLQILVGYRIDRFHLKFHNNRNGENLQRIDRLFSPRAGLVLKPFAGMSVYASRSVSWLPGSGDQFSSLTAVTQQLKPEKFTNDEAGLKWNLSHDLSFTAAAYRLNRTNTRSTDPNDPGRIVQTGSQRSKGLELGLTGALSQRWQVSGGYALQNAYITSATASSKAGASVPQVPRQTFSLWNHYRISWRLSAGLGLLNRSDMYAAIDNAVVLPAYTRVDAAVFYALTDKTRIQLNAENLLNRSYYVNADGNNNISPGSPRALRAGILWKF